MMRYPLSASGALAAFLARTTYDHGCWTWTGGVNAGGYSRMKFGGRRGRDVLGHRFVYESLVGPIPPRLVLDHLCRNPRCVNPLHLEPVTDGENVRRGAPCGNPGAWQRQKTKCPRGHAYEGDNLYRRPDGGRDCRACARDRSAAYNAARKAA